MLRKVQRLLPEEIPVLLRRGARYNTPHLDVRYQKNTNETCIGFIVAKSVDKRSTKRNRLKRVLRESIRLYLKNHTPHVHALFVMRKPLESSLHTVNTIVAQTFEIIGMKE